MEELEISMDEQHEAIHEHAEKSGERWMLYSALIAALLAVAAAVSGLYSSHYANEAMLEQMSATDQWSYYQAKGIKAALTELRADMLESAHQPVPAAVTEKIERYGKEQQAIKEQATEEEHHAEHFMHRHELLAKAVTAFQIAIAITAISAITRRRRFLIMSLVLALGGIEFMVQAFLI